MSNSEVISTNKYNTSREDLGNLLRQHNAEVTFTKRDGTTRIMKCTLREGVAIPYEKKTDREREPKQHILPVWDLEADAWRSVNIDTINDVKVY